MYQLDPLVQPALLDVAHHVVDRWQPDRVAGRAGRQAARR